CHFVHAAVLVIAPHTRSLPFAIVELHIAEAKNRTRKKSTPSFTAKVFPKLLWMFALDGKSANPTEAAVAAVLTTAVCRCVLVLVPQFAESRPKRTVLDIRLLENVGGFISYQQELTRSGRDILFAIALVLDPMADQLHQPPV